jgi:hypothetical protein
LNNLYDEIIGLEKRVNDLEELLRNVIGVVKPLVQDSDHTEYCMTSHCFRCHVAWGVYDD